MGGGSEKYMYNRRNKKSKLGVQRKITNTLFAGIEIGNVEDCLQREFTGIVAAGKCSCCGTLPSVLLGKRGGVGVRVGGCHWCGDPTAEEV